MTIGFDINRFKSNEPPTNQYERQLKRLTDEHKEVVCIEDAVREAIRNIADLDGRSFVIYGEPQSGKTEMMICLTAKLLDEGFGFILHLLNDSVDLLGQNLGRFKSSGLAPAARNFSEILDPAVKLKGQRHRFLQEERQRSPQAMKPTTPRPKPKLIPGPRHLLTI